MACAINCASLTRMQLVRTLASWRPDLTAYRDLDSAYQIGLRSLGRRYLELHDEIAGLDTMIAAIGDELAQTSSPAIRSAIPALPSFSLTAGDNPEKIALGSQLRIAMQRQPGSGVVGKDRGLSTWLNRGGDRAANSALHIIAIGRACEPIRGPRTTSLAIGSPKGISRLDAIRGLKRYLAREGLPRSSRSAARKSTPRRSPLDKQKGVREEVRVRPILKWRSHDQTMRWVGRMLALSGKGVVKE